MACVGRDVCQRKTWRRRLANQDQQSNTTKMSGSARGPEETRADELRCHSAYEAHIDLMLSDMENQSSSRLMQVVEGNENCHHSVKDARTLRKISKRTVANKYGSRRLRGLFAKYIGSPKYSSLQSVIVFSLLNLLILLNYQISCQRPPLANEPALSSPGSGRQLPFPLDGGQASSSAEPRADSSPIMLKPGGGNSNAMDQLVNLLQSYQSNQSNQNMRRSPLPLNGRGSQPNMQQVPNQQQGFSGPFNGQQFPAQQQSPNNKNNRQVSFQQPIFSISSSPPTPYLTLNRIANQAQQQQLANSQQNSNQQQNRFNNQLPQPLNTAPLLSPNSNRAGNVPPQMMAPPRGSQPGVGMQQRPQQQPPPLYNHLAGIPRPSLSPNLLQVPSVGPPVRPISGFAPSGPPPSSATNNAMVVVQSPSNAIGQAASSNRPVQSDPPQPQPSSSPTNKTTNEDDTRLPTTVVLPPETQTAKDSSPLSSSTPSTTTTVSTTTSATSNYSSSDSGGDNGNRENSTSIDAVTPIAADGSQSNKSTEPAQSSTAAATQATNQAGSSQTDQERLSTTSGEISATVKETNWNPVEGNRSLANEQINNRNKLAPSPDIVTVPPGYNPDNPNGGHNGPQAYDVSVSAQMGGPVVPARPQPPANETPTLASPIVTSSEVQTSSIQAQNIAPTAVTTIIWTAPPTDAVSMPSTKYAPTPLQAPASQVSSTLALKPTNGQQQPATTRIRDNSLIDQGDKLDEQADSGVVYGKPQARDSKPVAPSPPTNEAPASGDSSTAGRPFIQPVQIDNQVRPFSAGAASTAQQQQQHQPQLSGSLVKSNHHHPLAFKSSRPLTASNQQTPLRVGSGFTIAAAGNQTIPSGDIQDYVAAQPPLLVPQGQSHNPSSVQGSFQVGSSGGSEPVISAQGGPDPASFELAQQESSGPQESHRVNESQHKPTNTTRSESPAQQPPLRRRPTFKPKPAEPPIRIDSCIVDDDSSCDQSHNERCVTEYGISSCHCKPGYARLSQLRGYCSPVSLLQLSMKIDRLSDDRRLVYNHTLNNTNTEEYQYLEFETLQALSSAFQQTALAKHFMGARVNKFFERRGKVWANVSINFANNGTKADKIQSIATNELVKVTQSNQKPLGDSTIMLDGSKETVSRLVDVNECASRDLNDCSKFATCHNELGGFQCKCLAGFEDKHAASEDKAKHGRICVGCSPSYCSNRGECSISDGQKQCKCRPNFVGARCDYDTEVLAVAIGGSIIGLIILVVTCWCLYIFNRRWKREQQKMDAMSATSGLTYNYINSASTNSLMSPARIVGGLHRSGGHQVGSVAANYGQRFGTALINQTRGDQHYAPDQQAIIGSSSSGSSAASQPIGGCNPYTASGYQYEDVGLLIASASTGSSEQTSPNSNSYRDIMAAGGPMQLSYQIQPGNAYTLSGHHHHHHNHHQANMHHRHTGRKGQQQITQFHPAAAEYRTLNASGTMLCQPPGAAGNNYDNRWRTLRQEHNKQSNLVGYYLNPDTLTGQQQLYASPKRAQCDWN